MFTVQIMNVIKIALPAMVAFLAVNWSYFKVLRIAKEKKLVDAPDARKLQQMPVPVLGGIAVFFGIVTGILAGSVICSFVDEKTTSSLFPILCALVIMLYTGAMDDVIGLTPRSRFVIEILVLLGIIYASGNCIDNFHGLWGIYHFNWWIAVPLTVFGGVGIINAINMIDGVNGLSSGLCITCNLLFGIVFLLAEDSYNAILAFTVASALVPFFFHNVFGKRSRMFIGDAGTMMMGVLLTWFVIVLLGSDNVLWQKKLEAVFNPIAFALAILSVPVFDTVRVMLMRIIHGKSPFHPDKTHLHHVFVRMGISHTITSAIEILLDLIIVGLSFLFAKVGLSIEMQLYLVIVVSIILVWGSYFLFQWHEEHHTEFMHFLTEFGIKTHLGHTKWWMRLEAWLDGPEAYAQKPEVKPQKKSRLEDYYHFDSIPQNNYKEQDRKKLYDFLNGKAEVYVEDIKNRSGANPLRVDALIAEGMEDGFITQIKEGVWGTPMIVTLSSNE